MAADVALLGGVVLAGGVDFLAAVFAGADVAGVAAAAVPTGVAAAAGAVFFATAFLATAFFAGGLVAAGSLAPGPASTAVVAAAGVAMGGTVVSGAERAACSSASSSRTLAESDATSSAETRPTLASARSTSCFTSLFSASRLAALATSRSVANDWTWSAVAPPRPTRRLTTLVAFLRDDSVAPRATSRYARHASAIAEAPLAVTVVHVGCHGTGSGSWPRELPCHTIDKRAGAHPRCDATSRDEGGP